MVKVGEAHLNGYAENVSEATKRDQIWVTIGHNMVCGRFKYLLCTNPSFRDDIVLT